MGLSAYLLVSAALFLIGLVMVASRRNLIYVLMGLELILNAANLDFVAFDRFRPAVDGSHDGQMAAIFVILLAAAEAAIALAIVINAYALFGTVRPDDIDNLRD